MGYRLMGRLHAAVVTAWNRERGQGTVEYVALILLVAVVLAGIVTATKSSQIGPNGIGTTIVAKLKEALNSVGKPVK
ncbi:MAG: hypothetical protein ACR2ML_11080 [Solirubrobacteraceae bacterium]